MASTISALSGIKSLLSGGAAAVRPVSGSSGGSRPSGAAKPSGGVGGSRPSGVSSGYGGSTASAQRSQSGLRPTVAGPVFTGGLGSTVTGGLISGGQSTARPGSSGAASYGGSGRPSGKTGAAMLAGLASQLGSGVSKGQYSSYGSSLVPNRGVRNAVTEYINEKTGKNYGVNAPVSQYAAMASQNSGLGTRQKRLGGNAVVIPNDELYSNEFIKSNPNSARANERVRLDAMWAAQPNGMTGFGPGTTRQEAAAFINRNGGAYTNMGFMKSGADYLSALDYYGVDWESPTARADRITQSTAPRPGTPYYDAYVAAGGSESLSGATGGDLNMLLFNGGRYEDNGVYGTRWPSYGAQKRGGPGGEWSGDPAVPLAAFGLYKNTGGWDQDGNFTSLPTSGTGIARERADYLGVPWEDVANAMSEGLGGGYFEEFAGHGGNAQPAREAQYPDYPNDFSYGYQPEGSQGQAGFTPVEYTGLSYEEAMTAARGQVAPGLEDAIRQLEEAQESAIASVIRDYTARGLGNSSALADAVARIRQRTQEEAARMRQRAEYDIAALAQQIAERSQSNALEADMFNSTGQYRAYDDLRDYLLERDNTAFSQWLAMRR